MGHRRSHSRVTDKKGTSEMLTVDPKRTGETNKASNEVSSNSRREKRERKRKKEHKEDASRKRHKGKDHHHHSSKSSAKHNRKEKGSRWKNHRSSDSVSSESSSSASFTSIEKISHHHRSHSHSHSHSDARPGEHRRKRYRADNENLGKDYSRGNYEGLHDPTFQLPKVNKNDLLRQESTTKSRGESPMQWKDTSMGAIDSEVKVRHSESMRKDGHNATISRTMEQEKGLGGKKEKGLEVELRLKALANFMKHQDTTFKLDDHKASSKSASYFRDATNGQPDTDSVTTGQNQRALAEVDGDGTARLGALSDADATIYQHHCPLASDTLLPVKYKSPIKGSTRACHSNSSMEEGEISSDTVQPSNENDTRNVNSNPLVEEDEVVYERECTEKGDLCASIDASSKEHKLTSSGSLLEGAMVTDMQSELAGLTPKEVVQHSESIDLQHELPSKSKQEFKRINDTMEHHELKGLQTAAPVAREMIAGEVEEAGEQKTSTTTTSINEKPELLLEHERKNSEHVSEPELATGMQGGSTSFQQKTMSVMRGGELVQVNYKVYIPKRAAELARRRLHR